MINAHFCCKNTENMRLSEQAGPALEVFDFMCGVKLFCPLYLSFLRTRPVLPIEVLTGNYHK